MRNRDIAHLSQCWKYIHIHHRSSNGFIGWYEDSKAQLFNLNKDHKELNDLIANPEYANVVKELNTIAMENYIEKSEAPQKKKTDKKKTKKKKNKKD